MESEFYLGDRICKKSSFAMTMNIFFSGAEKNEDGYWIIRLGYGGNYGQAGFGFASSVRVKMGETISFGDGYRTDLMDMSRGRSGKKKNVSALNLIIKEIRNDRIVLETHDYR